ncbi:MAG: ribonuclease III [Candidatus Cloacimonadota bacterium]|nr:ribonuclease III [Candidatus Cloacimonadota bacterium]
MKNFIKNFVKSKNNAGVVSDLDNLQKYIGYKFENISLLRAALTHTSYKSVTNHYSAFERMEFLGDSILGLVVAEHIFNKFPNYTEGNLSKLKAKLVSRKFLALKAKKINLGDYLFLSSEAAKNGERSSKSILGDAMEALICAIYLDSNLEQAANFIQKFIIRNYKSPLSEEDMTNYKSKLQEYTQSKYQEVPEYKIIGESGPDHDKIFTAEVCICKKTLGTGEGSTKKEAQQQAAKGACNKLEL